MGDTDDPDLNGFHCHHRYKDQGQRPRGEIGESNCGACEEFCGYREQRNEQKPGGGQERGFLIWEDNITLET